VSSWFVERTVELTPSLTVELRVSHATARAWNPAYEGLPWLQGTCAGRALLEAHDVLRTCHVDAGRWRFTWTDVLLEIERA
jgi:hypothetical protein